ncbi:MAG: hypothetical protein KAS57_06680 [Gammaproteobacteria bacterium]|nr:hypothetical protein [Gammaproteobacteria bacterium]
MKSPELFTEPRFWAEEGRYYYSNIQKIDIFSSLLLIIRGNYQLLTNIIVLLSSMVPAQWAAYITTYLALCVALVPVLLLYYYQCISKWPLFLPSLITSVYALMPQGYEVFFTATNVQWICSVSILIVCILPLEYENKNRHIATYAWLIICGLTGVTSVMLAPGFLLRGMLNSSRHHIQMGLLLSFFAIVHLVIIFNSDHPDRLFPMDLFSLTMPTLLQTVLSPLISADMVNVLVSKTVLDGKVVSWWYLVSIALSSLVIMSGVIYAAFKQSDDKNVPLVIVLLWIGVSVLNTIGSIGDPEGLLSGWGGGRYFFFGSVCFVLLLAISVSGKSRLYSSFSLAILLLVIVTGVIEAATSEWQNFILTGPSWRSEVVNCHDLRPCNVTVWPGGDTWSFDLVRK